MKSRVDPRGLPILALAQQMRRHLAQPPARPEHQPAEPRIDQQRRVAGRSCAGLLQPVSEVEPAAANIDPPATPGAERHGSGEIVIANDEALDVGALDAFRVRRQRE